jgi:hypothetical protein
MSLFFSSLRSCINRPRHHNCWLWRATSVRPMISVLSLGKGTKGGWSNALLTRASSPISRSRPLAKLARLSRATHAGELGSHSAATGRHAALALTLKPALYSHLVWISTNEPHGHWDIHQHLHKNLNLIKTSPQEESLEMEPSICSKKAPPPLGFDISLFSVGGSVSSGSDREGECWGEAELGEHVPRRRGHGGGVEWGGGGAGARARE